MSYQLLTSFRRLSLNPFQRPLYRNLATVSEPPAASTSVSTLTETEHKWQTRPPRKLTARERAIPGRVKIDAPTPEGHLRPHLGIDVTPNHGLYGFFRRVKDDVTGASRYETVEPKHKTNDFSGRAWLASELRRKSFKDLHTLWYVLARERNLLATQAHEARRSELEIKAFGNLAQRNMRCKKSMARIKQVLNERRLAYEEAVKLHKEGITFEQLTSAEAEELNKTEAVPRSSGMLEGDSQLETVQGKFPPTKTSSTQ